jgi:hypothetical protein
MMRRRRWHRAVFAAAGVYNIAWGLSTAIEPQWLYRLTGGEAADRAEFVTALGLVIGLYGVLYLEVARAPEQGWLIAAVGLAGKVLGPIGLVWLIIEGEWPASALWICVTNDFVWWVPFALYLWDAWVAFRDGMTRAAPPLLRRAMLPHPPAPSPPAERERSTVPNAGSQRHL